MNRTEKAEELYKNGYNCSQAVFTAFADLYGLDEETSLKLSTSFGGGIGGSRKICGAVLGMALVAGMESGTAKPKDTDGKKKNYEMVGSLFSAFEKEHGTIVCSHLRGIEECPVPVKKRPCREYVRFCAELIEKTIIQNNDNQTIA